MASTRQDLLRLLASKSFRLGQFKLSSGGTSDYYIDCRTTTLAAKGARKQKPDAAATLARRAFPRVRKSA